MGLFDAIRVGLSGLSAAQAGLETASNNVANVNTPGFARVRANLEDVILYSGPNYSVPGGTRVQGLQSMRSNMLDGRVASAQSGLSGADTALSYLGRIEDMVAPGGVSALGEPLNRLTSALTELSARPEDPALRATVLDAADHLAVKVRDIGNSLGSLQAEAQTELAVHADHVNQLTARLADLNRQVNLSGEDTAGRAAWLTQRTQVVNELAKEVDIRTYDDEEGRIFVTLSDGTALVATDRSYRMSVDPAPNGAVTLLNRDVTSAIDGGAMGGLISARDSAIVPGLMRLDAIASSLATAVNGQNQAGFDLAGAPGTDVFTLGVGANPGAQARGFARVLTSGDQIAAAATPAPGDGANATALASAAASLTAAVGQLSYRAGADASKVSEERGAASAMFNQATNAREELSGVSLDEEAADLMRYQRAYEASAKVLKTVDDLLTQLMNSLGQ